MRSSRLLRRCQASGSAMMSDDDRPIGVGPYSGPWPEDPRLDPELLQHGDTRNVADEYRYWLREAIVADLDVRRHPFHVAIENWQHDFNIGTIVRNANAFLAHTVHIVGKRRWNRRGAMVTDRYQHIQYHATIEEFVGWAKSQSLVIIGIDILDSSTPIERASLPDSCILVFGQEGPGLSSEMVAAADAVYEISQFGSTRSINVGVASGIAMHTWIRQHRMAGS
jgi:tRNA G18 (ribose-2'-O)-methylase SpoU